MNRFSLFVIKKHGRYLIGRVLAYNLNYDKFYNTNIPRKLLNPKYKTIKNAQLPKVQKEDDLIGLSMAYRSIFVANKQNMIRNVRKGRGHTGQGGSEDGLNSPFPFPQWEGFHRNA